jgi:hypothetical protein
VQRDPLLLELAALAQLHSKLPSLACHILDGIEARITADNSAQRVAAIACEGQIMAEGFAALADMPMHKTVGPVGAAFGLSRAMEHGQVDGIERQELLAAIANLEAELANSGRLPRSLSIMRLYAACVVAAPNHQLRRRDGVKLVIHSLTGWPNP